VGSAASETVLPTLQHNAGEIPNETTLVQGAKRPESPWRFRLGSRRAELQCVFQRLINVRNDVVLT